MHLSQIKTLSDDALDMGLATALGVYECDGFYCGVLLSQTHSKPKIPCYSTDHAAAWCLGLEMSRRLLTERFMKAFAAEVNVDTDPHFMFQAKMVFAPPRQLAEAALTVLWEAKRK